MKSRITCALVFLGLAFGFCMQAEAADYYVDGGNSAASDSNSGTANSPWKTISKANSTVAAGDRVFIKAGIYSSHVEPAASGTASQPITYLNFGTDVVTISNSTLGIQLINKNYITVKGINCVYCDTFLNLEGSSHNVIDHCTFSQMRTFRLWAGSRLYYSSQYNWIHDCSFSRYGFNDTQDNGSVLAIGEEENTSDFSDYNLFENNIFFYGGHDVVGLFTRHNVIRNNYFHNENWQNGHGNRCMITGGYQVNSGWNLIDGNKFCYSGYPADAAGAPGLTIATERNIIRRNNFYHCNENGLLLGYTANYADIPSNNRIYHNTFFHNGFNPASPNEARCGIGLARWTGTSTIVSNIIKNNLFWANTTAINSYGVDMTAQTLAGNLTQTSDPLFLNASTALGDPFNSTNPNLAVPTNSPCNNAGVFLAKIVSPSGSGTSFRVDEAGYFVDGWGIIQGDLIQLQGSSQRARITNIDYVTMTLRFDTALTWTQNQGVSLAYEGSAPDVGAFEIGAGLADTNQPPIVTTGPDQIINFPTNTVTLRGSAVDANKDPLTFSWSEVSGPAAATFSAANSSNTIATISVRGGYVFRLTVSDGKTTSSADISVSFTPDPNALVFEAENGSISAPFVAQNGYIVQNSLTGVTDGGRAAYIFTLTNASNYVVTALLNAPDDSANSFFVNIDAEPVDPTMIWDTPITSGFESRTVSWRGTGTSGASEFVPKVFSLAAGTHTLIIRGREPGAQIDRLQLSIAGPKPAPPANLRIVSSP